MQTVVETTVFARRAEKRMTEEERAALIEFLALTRISHAGIGD